MLSRTPAATTPRDRYSPASSLRKKHIYSPRKRFRSSFAVGLTMMVVLVLGLLLGLSYVPQAGAATLTQTQAELATAKAELQKRQAELDELMRRYSEAEQRLSETEDRISEVQQQIEIASADLATTRSRLDSRLRDVYMNGGSGGMAFLEALLDGRSLSAIFNRISMLGRVVSVDQDVFIQVERQLKALEDLETELGLRQQDQADQLDELDQAHVTALDVLEKSKDEYNALRERVRKLEEEERKRREAEAERARAAAARSSSKSSSSSGGRVVGTSGWVFPVQGPNSFINDWGFRRSGGRTHKGTDIMTPRNTPVVAVVSGAVTRTRTTDGGLGGITIWLVGSDGNSYYYAHLTSIASGIRPGTNVKAGQVIGYAGNTGNARGGEVHLHFEIHPGGGAAINPYPTLIANR